MYQQDRTRLPYVQYKTRETNIDNSRITQILNGVIDIFCTTSRFGHMQRYAECNWGINYIFPAHTYTQGQFNLFPLRASTVSSKERKQLRTWISLNQMACTIPHTLS